MLPAKIILAAFCRLRAFPERIFRSGISLWVICFLTAGSAAIAQPDDQAETAFLVALELCSEEVATLESARTTLVKAGWTDFERGPAPIIASNLIAFAIDETDLSYTVENASFMTASILGNSALGPNQPAFEHSNVRLALIGVEEGSQYCVLSGPDWMLRTALLNGVSGKMQAKTQMVSLMLGGFRKAVVGLALLNVDEFVQAHSALDTDAAMQEEMRAALMDVLMPSNIQIFPAENNGVAEEN